MCEEQNISRLAWVSMVLGWEIAYWQTMEEHLRNISEQEVPGGQAAYTMEPEGNSGPQEAWGPLQEGFLDLQSAAV